MVSFKFVLLAVVTLLLRGYPSMISGAGAQCTSGFLDFDSVDESSIVTLPNEDLVSNFRRWIFPNINFTCDGYITSWILRVNNSISSVDTMLIPQITTWRLQETVAITGISRYMQQSITNNISKIVGGMIEYTPSEPIPIQAGDVVGIGLDEGMLRIRPLFLRLPEGNSSAISCVGLQGNSETFFFNATSQSCLHIDERNQSMYIPLISVAISPNVPTSTVSPSSSATISSTPPATTIAATPPPTGSITDPTLGLTPTTTDSSAPPQSGANSNQLVGVIVGALVAALSLVLIVILAVFLVLLLTKRKSQNLYDVPVPPQPQTGMDSTVSSNFSQSIEVKNNDAYSLSTIQQIPTENNVAYGQATPQIPTEDNVAYGLATAQILTRDNVAYGQAMPQIPTVESDNVAYGHQATLLQFTTEDNVTYGCKSEGDYMYATCN